MENFELIITLRKDGHVQPGFPVTKRVVVEQSQSFVVDVADAGNSTTFVKVPADNIGTIQLLVMKTFQPLTLRFNGQTDAGILLNNGGLIAIVDATINAGAGAANAKVNANGQAAVLEGVAGGL